jgi:hypothetical protein
MFAGERERRGEIEILFEQNEARAYLSAIQARGS